MEKTQATKEKVDIKAAEIDPDVLGELGRGKAKGRESGNGGKDGRRLSPLVCPFKGRKKTGENPPAF